MTGLSTLIVNSLNTQKSTHYTAPMVISAFDNEDGTFMVCTNDDCIYTIDFPSRTDIVNCENEMLRNLPDNVTVILSQPSPSEY